LESMAGTTGLEPATSAVTGQHSNQLNYVPFAFSHVHRLALHPPSCRSIPLPAQPNTQRGTVTIPYLDCSKVGPSPATLDRPRRVNFPHPTPELVSSTHSTCKVNG
jgi:hypothetical protein